MQEVHLLVGVNGMWGNPGHLAHLASVISAQFEDSEDEAGGCQLEVFLAQNNRHTTTYDGIDWGGERVADEVITKIREIEEDGSRQVVKFSAVGYSLGGLVARYVVGIMSSRNLFLPSGRIKPMNFTTFATPHIGIPVYPTFFSSLGPHLAPKFLSRTGEQFFGRDKWSETGRPLLEVMADKNRMFWKTLASFEKVVFYANAVNDRTVPYVTGGIDTHDPFMLHETNGIHIEIDEDYPPLIKSYTVTDTPPPPPPVPPLFSVARVQSWAPRAPPLPPFLKYRFPFNLVVYALLPIMIPIFIPLVFGRFAIDSRASRKRIKLLEKEKGEEGGTLLSMWTHLEKDMDDVVADMIDDPGMERSGAGEDGMVAGAILENPERLPSGGQPTLTPAQKRMVKNLNELPGLIKRLAFLHPMVNSHGTIICRDIPRFAFHKLGEGVLRHWADGFVL